MPAHLSYLLQPLDVGYFSPLKKAYGRQIEVLIRRHVTHITKADFFPAFCRAFEDAFTTQNIQGGFRGAWIVPIDPESVIAKLDVKLRTPTPPESIPELPLPWMSKTPDNPVETVSQT